MADCIGTDCKREVLQAEVERLRGIVQADLEEKAEAWGEVERLRQLYDNEHTIACRLRTALKTVGDDYPGSSCQQWCYEQAGLTLTSPGASHGS